MSLLVYKTYTLTDKQGKLRHKKEVDSVEEVLPCSNYKIEFLTEILYVFRCSLSPLDEIAKSRARGRVIYDFIFSVSMC